MLLPPPGGRPSRESRALTPARAARGKSAALAKVAGPALPLERAVTRFEETVFTVIESEVGGRQALVELLAVVIRSDLEDRLLAQLADPLNDGRSLAAICANLHLNRGHLYEKIKAAALARAQTKATLKVAEHLPAVALGVMEDAIPGKRACRLCAGLCVVAGKPTADGPPEEIPCPACRGAGMVEFAPEHDTRKLALQLGKLVDRPGGGPHISVLQQNATLNAGLVQTGTYDRLVGALDTALYGAGRDRLSTMQTTDTEGTVE